MIKLLKNPLLVAILILSVCAVSCNKEDKVKAVTPPDIKTLSNLEGLIGSSVTILGSNLKSVDRIRFGAKDAAGFNASNNTDTAITVQVPAGVSYGNLLLQVYISGVGSDQANFKVIEPPRPPTVTGAAPATGFPGTSVTLTGTNLEIINQVKFGSVVAVFTSTSTSLTTTVPDAAVAGSQLITVSGPGGSATASFNVNLAPEITSFTPTTAAAGATVTVTGKRFTGASAVKIGSTNTTFTIVSGTQITFTIPAGAVSGLINITNPNGTGSSGSPLTVLVAGLLLPFYNDAVTSNWNGWIGGGWGGTKDLDNTSPVRSGSKSCKIDYVGGWGSPLQLGGASVNLASYSTFKISIYGGAGTNGLKINIGINASDAYTITLVEGVWTDYTIPISSLTSATTLTEIWVKEFNGTGGFTIYVDDMGLN
jgi:hypothetical protein